MKGQRFGVEIEFTGVTRWQAAQVVAAYFGTSSNHEGGAYDKYTVTDQEGRKWQILRDSSVRAERKQNGGFVPASDEYKVEMVTPICRYEDIETIQELVRRLRRAGGHANLNCGLHIHIDASNHNAKTLRNLVNLMASKEDMIYRAFEVDAARAAQYCKKVDQDFVNELNRVKPQTMDQLKDLWYKSYGGDGSHMHYHASRYHGLNLHAVFSKGTCEYRIFNSTLAHAGKIKAYIQFCLAMSHQALTQKSASARKTTSTNEKFTFRTWLLRLGLIGDEYKTARLHILANLHGNAAFRYAA